MLKKILGKIFTTERIIWLVLVIAGILGVLFFMMRSNNYEEKYDNAVQNNKAYALQLDKEKAQSNVFKLTVDQLSYYNDSIMTVLNNARKELKIKDNQIAQLNYIATELNKKDTIKLTDTIFKDADFVLDTAIGDKWITTKLYMAYPNTVAIEPTVVSEKSVFMYTNKETVEPPKKFFLCRWFQKKHTVMKAIVKENNPYVVNQENVFIEIVK